MAKRIDVANLPVHSGTFYPPPYDKPCRSRFRKKLGDAAGLTQVGVNLTRLAPGSWSSQRHWHSHEDEFIYILEGEVVLVTEAGEEIMQAGDCAGFRCGEEDGHHLQNRSDREAVYLEIGARQAGDGARYPGIDLAYPPGGVPARFTRRDGTPYEDIRRRGPEDAD